MYIYCCKFHLHELEDPKMIISGQPIKPLEVTTTRLDLTDVKTLLSLDLLSNFDEQTILRIITEAKKQTGQG